MATSIHVRRSDGLSDGQITPAIQIIVFVCPTEGCGNYYASSIFQPGDPALTEVQKRRDEEGVKSDTHPRVECPACRVRGINVNRVPFVVTTLLPVDIAVAEYRKAHPKKKEPK